MESGVLNWKSKGRRIIKGRIDFWGLPSNLERVKRWRFCANFPETPYGPETPNKAYLVKFGRKTAFLSEFSRDAIWRDEMCILAVKMGRFTGSYLVFWAFRYAWRWGGAEWTLLSV